MSTQDSSDNMGEKQNRKNSKTDIKDIQPPSVITTMIKRKWPRFIVYELLEHESLRYSELINNIDDISDNSLTRALDELEEDQLVNRQVVAEKPVRVEYSLTEAGAAIESVVNAAIEWEKMYEDYIEDTDKNS